MRSTKAFTNKNARLVTSVSGLSLVELLMALGLMMIVGLAMMEMQRQQNLMLRGVEEKQEVLALKSLILDGFGNINSCTWQLKDLTFSATGDTSLVPNPYANIAVNLPGSGGRPELRIGGTNIASSLLVAKKGEKIAASTPQMKVNNVSLENIERLGTSDDFKGDIVISLDASTMVRPLRPIKISKFFRSPIDTVDTSVRKITSCVNPSTQGAVMASAEVASVYTVGTTCSQACQTSSRFCGTGMIVDLSFGTTGTFAARRLVSCNYGLPSTAYRFDCSCLGSDSIVGNAAGSTVYSNNTVGKTCNSVCQENGEKLCITQALIDLSFYTFAADALRNFASCSAGLPGSAYKTECACSAPNITTNIGSEVSAVNTLGKNCKTACEEVNKSCVSVALIDLSFATTGTNIARSIVSCTYPMPNSSYRLDCSCL